MSCSFCYYGSATYLESGVSSVFVFVLNYLSIPFCVLLSLLLLLYFHKKCKVVSLFVGFFVYLFSIYVKNGVGNFTGMN